MAINLRSPHYKGTAIANTAYATLAISIWEGDSSTPVTAQYNLRKSIIGTSVQVTFEISELIKDYLDITFNGNYVGQNVWVQTVQTAYNSVDVALTPVTTTTEIAFDSYSYFQESSFDISGTPLLISNREIFSLDDNLFRLPIYTVNNPVAKFYLNNVLLSTHSFFADTDSTSQIAYVSLNGEVDYTTYKERVTDGGGTLEDSYCLASFLDTFSIGAVDKVIVSDDNGIIETVKINLVEECKYDPKKVTFVNKFGALQDMYFFKKSKENLRVKKESYKSNIVDASGVYNNTNHVNREFNVVGSESISLSSGYLSEEYNEVFKQLLLSEKVWLTEIKDSGELVTPINVKTSSIAYKTSVNDKLVDYTISFDKSFDTINNIR
jgi:hypothetical protein